MATATVPRPAFPVRPQPEDIFDPHFRERVAALPNGLEESVTAWCCCPKMSDEVLMQRAITADMLSRLTGRLIQVKYNPGTFFKRDGAALGHVFTARWNDWDDENDDDVITLDGRKGNLAKQFAKELDRIGRLYYKLAQKVRKGIARDGVNRLLIERTTDVGKEGA